MSASGASLVLLRYVYDRAPETGAKYLFLQAMAERRRGNYDKFQSLMLEFVAAHPNSTLMDDALAELGLYHMQTHDFVQAEGYLRRVVEEFPQANAFDNALNWLVLLYRDAGKIDQAISTSARLVSVVSSKRLKDAIAGRHEALLELKPGAVVKKVPALRARPLFPGYAMRNELGKYEGELLAWPVKLRENTAVDGGAITINARTNELVRSATGGAVAYVGRDRRKQELYIIVRCKPGLFAVYSHLASPLVKEGDALKPGQAIAFVGPQDETDLGTMRFELRAGKMRIAPGEYMNDPPPSPEALFTSQPNAAEEPL